PVLPPGFYITSYTQLTTNGVTKLPDAYKWDDAAALMEELSLDVGPYVVTAESGCRWDRRPDFQNAGEFFAWRAVKWRDAYDLLSIDPDDSFATMEKAFDREIEALAYWHDADAAAKHREKLHQAFAVLKHLFALKPTPRIAQLTNAQFQFVLREYCAERLERYAEGIGAVHRYCLATGRHIPAGSDAERDRVPTRPIKCVYSPSLSDLSYNAYDCVVIDEGVKMKGEDTLVGLGVRQLAPKYRLVLTATPVKNRLPDIFRLAWWAAGGEADAHARFPYRDDSSERQKFAATFMFSERNLTKEEKAKAEQSTQLKRGNGNVRSVARKVAPARFTKLTAEVCNVHRLWKLLAPLVLRRRKQDCGEDIVPRVRRVIRCEMGTQQQQVYRYHLDAAYLDVNGQKAVGAQLQALRAAAADPSSVHLIEKPGQPMRPCECATTKGNGSFEISLKTLKSAARCQRCGGTGTLPLPHRSGHAYIPKMASTLTLVQEILARGEQVLIGSAFNDPLDVLSDYLTEAGVRHVTLDGRVSQKKRGQLAANFKQGRTVQTSAEINAGGAATVPVMLAGVECMAEGHSFHRANNVILIAYSWAYDKFKQFLDRVHRMNSERPVNVYVIVCAGTIDHRLESLVQDKGDAAELVLDGRLIGERTEEVNLAELLRVAHREFDAKEKTIDEALLYQQWPALRDRLATAMQSWDNLPHAPRTTHHAIAFESETQFPVPITINPTRNPQPATLPTPMPIEAPTKSLALTRTVGRVGEPQEFIELADGSRRRWIVQRSGAHWMIYFTDGRQVINTLASAADPAAAEAQARVFARDGIMHRDQLEMVAPDAQRPTPNASTLLTRMREKAARLAAQQRGDLWGSL
ncbi:MAG: DEAD/DEAH box helicase, partial [Patescibacteria group bacterium]|nr:DEAD/DEAH box helicase [Patescibacteria group bacterium]